MDRDWTGEFGRGGEAELREASDAIKIGGKDETTLPDKVLVIVVEESETILMSDRKVDHKIFHKEELEEEGMIEEAQKNDADKAAVEAQIASNEIFVENEFVAQDDVLTDDDVLTEKKVLAVEKVLTENDTLAADEVLAEDDVLTEDDALAQDEVLAANEVLAEDDTLAEDDVLAVDEVLLPDAITPSMMLIVFNIILPTVDIFLDTALVQKLFLNGYWCSGLAVTAGIVTNFLFTSLAWWRLEPVNQKKWSWIFLALQLWPQLRAFQVHAAG